MIRSMLYATDLGLYAPYVMQHALALARTFKADLDVIHVVEPIGLFAESVLQSYLDETALSEWQSKGLSTVMATIEQRVLDSFREVEDYLVQLRVLEQEAVLQQQALDAARESLRLIENQYKAGTVDFNSVVNVQATALNNERSTLSLLGSRLTASVQLIAALGGGWQQEE